MLTVLEDKILSFRGSVLGFETVDRMKFSTVDDKGIYGFLQDEENEHIGFLVVNPFVFYPDYSFEVEDSVKKFLGVSSHEDVVVLNVVTIHEPFDQSTVNLLAPLILNIKNDYGKQIVLPPKCNYSTKEPLILKKEESGV